MLDSTTNSQKLEEMFYDSNLTDYKLQFKYGSLLNLKTLEQLETEGLKYTSRKDKSKRY